MLIESSFLSSMVLQCCCRARLVSSFRKLSVELGLETFEPHHESFPKVYAYASTK